MENGDSEREQNNDEEQKKENTGHNNIRKYPLHNMVHERIQNIVMKLPAYLLFSNILDNTINEARRESLFSGRFFRHFYDTLIKL